jgi:ABC-type nickel/cobalt efflux system permease component RcnA
MTTPSFFNLFGLISPSGLSITEILLLSYILGLLHGATPDEHTWPITFSYAIGEYSTKGGMKAGLLFSLGFTIERAILTTLGFLGLAYFYIKYNLDGPVYIIVGIVMAIAGMYILKKGVYKHIEIGKWLGLHQHHSALAERVKPKEELVGEIPLNMTIIHGFIAGVGFGAYASVITFVLAPQVGSIWYAPLPGALFGLGTMTMQILFGALFANLLRAKKLTEEQIKYVGRKAAGRTLYYGGLAFVAIGALVMAIPAINDFAISTGIPIPNLDAFGIGLFLVLLVVGIIGGIGLWMSYKEIINTKYSKKRH